MNVFNYLYRYWKNKYDNIKYYSNIYDLIKSYNDKIGVYYDYNILDEKTLYIIKVNNITDKKSYNTFADKFNKIYNSPIKYITDLNKLTELYDLLENDKCQQVRFFYNKRINIYQINNIISLCNELINPVKQNKDLLKRKIEFYKKYFNN